MRDSHVSSSKLRAAIYVRISKDRELGKAGEGLGVQRQQQDCQELADRMGWQVVEVFRDNDRSASNGKLREDYQRLLDWIREGQIDVVVVWHTDRLHRSTTELEEYAKVCNAMNVPTHTVKSGHIDLKTPTGRMVAGILGLTARFEVEHKAERLAAKYRQMAIDGKSRRVSARPFGFERDGITIKPDEAAELLKATRAVNAGEGLKAICRDLNSRGIKTTMDKEWSYTSLRKMLLRPRNIGQSVYRGQVVGEAEWDAVVPIGEFLTCQRILTDPSRRTTPGSGRKHLLTNIAKCGKCGKGLLPGMRPNRDGTPFRMYRCCVYRDIEELEHLVSRAVVLILTKHDARKLLTPAQPASKDLEQERSAIEAQMNEAADAFTAKLITMAQLTRITSDLQDRMEKIDAGLIDRDRARIFDGLISVPDVMKAWKSLSLARKRTVVNTLFTITVQPVGRGKVATAEHTTIRLKNEVAHVLDMSDLSTMIGAFPDESQMAEVVRAFS
ncbi:recombinase family protein [Kribbella jiaozuonensis]|uniref:Recombinase family protein n=1 Tax=Kribbella jiaozuonensis TaxID=2575441 RepID=A0A4U3M542_9ACTN|nr:recombinase family protein [Kribbella jiaozuonensis]TKK79189.1 recombinase family protein [Kribbella jiaozuonensis]TKK83259.1 recombinase family protein [Kribbella jiaozuonensis]